MRPCHPFLEDRVRPPPSANGGRCQQPVRASVSGRKCIPSSSHRNAWPVTPDGGHPHRGRCVLSRLGAFCKNYSQFAARYGGTRDRYTCGIRSQCGRPHADEVMVAQGVALSPALVGAWSREIIRWVIRFFFSTHDCARIGSLLLRSLLHSATLRCAYRQEWAF